MWQEHQRGLRNHATSLWSTLMFELWARRFLDTSSSGMTPMSLPAGARPTRVDSAPTPV
jgi:hypothetical protein